MRTNPVAPTLFQLAVQLRSDLVPAERGKVNWSGVEALVKTETGVTVSSLVMAGLNYLSPGYG